MTPDPIPSADSVAYAEQVLAAKKLKKRILIVLASVLGALLVLLLFGGKKIPELMKGLGKGVKSFKEGVNGIEKDIKAEPEKKETSENTEE